MTTTWAGDVATQVDYEAELGVIIGRPAKDVPVRDALDYVWGYTVVNDITARDIQFSEAQWSRCKSFDGFTPTGRRHGRRGRRPAGPVAHDQRRRPHPAGRLDERDGAERGRDHLLPLEDRHAAGQHLISTGSPGGAGCSRNPQVFLHDGSTVTVTIEGMAVGHLPMVLGGAAARGQGCGRSVGSARRSTTLIACVIGATPDRRDGRSLRDVLAGHEARLDDEVGDQGPSPAPTWRASRPRRSR